MTKTAKPRRARVDDRGDYKRLYCCLADDGDFHALSGDAAKLLFVLMMTLPKVGIAVIYPSKLCDQVGCDRDRLDVLFAELQRPKAGRPASLGWVVREGNVVWLVNGLRYCGSLHPENRQKHGPLVRKDIAPLGDTEIIRRFKAHYPEWFAIDDGYTPDTPDIGRAYTPDTVSEKANTRGEERSREEIKAPTAIEPMDYTVRCVVALNRGMQHNASVTAFMEVNASSQHATALQWQEDGIPITFAEEVIADVCAKFKPRPGSPSIRSLSMIESWLRPRWEQHQGAGRSSSLADRARILFDIAKQYDLLRYCGNREEYVARVEQASKDPRAGEHFGPEFNAARVWDGIADQQSDHWATNEIAKRLESAGIRVA